MIPCPQVVPRTEVGMFTCLSATILNSRLFACIGGCRTYLAPQQLGAPELHFCLQHHHRVVA